MRHILFAIFSIVPAFCEDAKILIDKFDVHIPLHEPLEVSWFYPEDAMMCAVNHIGDDPETIIQLAMRSYEGSLGDSISGHLSWINNVDSIDYDSSGLIAFTTGNQRGAVFFHEKVKMVMIASTLSVKSDGAKNMADVVFRELLIQLKSTASSQEAIVGSLVTYSRDHQDVDIEEDLTRESRDVSAKDLGIEIDEVHERLKNYYIQPEPLPFEGLNRSGSFYGHRLSVDHIGLIYRSYELLKNGSDQSAEKELLRAYFQSILNVAIGNQYSVEYPGKSNGEIINLAFTALRRVDDIVIDEDELNKSAVVDDGLMEMMGEIE